MIKLLLKMITCTAISLSIAFLVACNATLPDDSNSTNSSNSSSSSSSSNFSDSSNSSSSFGFSSSSVDISSSNSEEIDDEHEHSYSLIHETVKKSEKNDTVMEYTLSGYACSCGVDLIDDLQVVGLGADGSVKKEYSRTEGGIYKLVRGNNDFEGVSKVEVRIIKDEKSVTLYRFDANVWSMFV